MQRKKKYCLLCGGSGALFLVLLVVLVVLLKHEPDFYREAEVAAGPKRQEQSSRCASLLAQLGVNFKVDKGGAETIVFEEAEVNSFFQEDFVRYGESELRQAGISEPRVALEDDRLRLAFRYGSGLWSTVVSYDVKVWVVPREPNVLAVEILGRRAGAVPISPQSFLSDLTELASHKNIEVTPYRHEGHPVALLRFPTEQNRSTAHLQHIQVEAHKMTIQVGSADGRQTALPKKNLVPNGN